MADPEQKKVVYILGTLRLGGTERQVVETIVNLDRTRFAPKLYCLSGGGALQAEINRLGIDVTIFNSVQPPCTEKQIPLRRCRKFFALYRYLRREQPDILHCYLYPPSIYGGLVGKLTKVPVMIASRRSLGLFKDDKPHFQVLENLVNRFITTVLVNSQAVKEDVLQRERIKAAKVQVLYNGIDLQKYRPLNHEMSAWCRLKKQELNIPEQASVVGMIANLIPYKGHREFILAASIIHRDHPDTYFLCVGEDRGIQRQLEQLAQELGLHHHVIFTGQLLDVSGILHLMDIQVSASHEEGFSNAILEGMASGKPIVATAVGGNPEAVVHKVTGLLVPTRNPAALAHATISLLDAPELAVQFGRNGRQRAEELFARDKMIHELESLYLTRLAQTQPARRIRKD